MNTFKLIELNAVRVKETEGIYKGFNKTELYSQDGTLKAVIPVQSTQPRKDKKTITVNCFIYKINWL